MPRPLVTYVLCQGIDRIFVNLPMAEARDFRCSSYVVENLGKKNYSERPRCSTPRHSETYSSRTPEPTYSQLDIKTSHFLTFNADSQRMQRDCRVNS